jgi:glycolate oxidase
MIGEQVLTRLKEIVGEAHVLTDPADLYLYTYDASLHAGKPDVVVFPDNTAQVSQVVSLAQAGGIPIVARGGGTNLSGGSVPTRGGIVLVLSRMTRVLEIDPPNQRAVVEAGLYNLSLQEALMPYGYLFAPDPASQKVATMGGTVGENAGGPHCLKYGVTTNHVLGLEVVLPDGKVVQLGGAALDAPGYDLVGLLIGSEGTLGIVTSMTVRILRQPESIKTMLVVFDDLSRAGQTVSDIIAAGIIPATLEMMDNLIIRAVQAATAAGFPLDAEAVLIVELDGLVDDMDRQVQDITTICQRNGATEVRVAKDAAERDALWAGRRGAFGAVGRIKPSYLVNDGTVPRTALPTVLRQIKEIGERYDLPVGNVFHAGDGNLHPLLLFDPAEEGIKERVEQAGEEIMRVCVEAGGTITGEHGVGLEKIHGMSLIASPEAMDAMRWVKDAFDPWGQYNPDKILPARQGGTH